MADYTTKAQVIAIINSKGLATDATDDAVIEQLIDAASAYIAGETHREFVAAAGTRYFDTPLPGERILYTDEYTSLTTVTNGDATVIPSTDYIMLPANVTPKWGIKLKSTVSYDWAVSSTSDREQAITIVAPWGYSTAAPADVRSLCEGIVINLYQSRRGQGAEGVATITGAGVVITPKDIPAWGDAIIRRYTRRT